MSEKSAYELAREAQIARNKEEIKRIGLAAARRRARDQAVKAAATAPSSQSPSSWRA